MFVIEFLKKSFSKKYVFVYFDVSSFSKNNFKQKAWSEIGKSPRIKNFYVYSKIHHLFLMTGNGFIGFQIIKDSINTLDLVDFFKRLKKIIVSKAKKKKIIILLDNATRHYTKIFKNFCIKNSFFLFFTTKTSPFLNPSEYFFGY